MIENKRFTRAPTNNKGWVVLDRGNILWSKETIQLLNELHEENEELKQQNQRWEKICCEGLRINNRLRKRRIVYD